MSELKRVQLTPNAANCSRTWQRACQERRELLGINSSSYLDHCSHCGPMRRFCTLLKHQLDTKPGYEKNKTKKKHTAFHFSPFFFLAESVGSNFSKYFWAVAIGLSDQTKGFYPEYSALLQSGSVLFKHKQSSIVVLETVLHATSLRLPSRNSGSKTNTLPTHTPPV